MLTSVRTFIRKNSVLASSFSIGAFLAVGVLLMNGQWNVFSFFSQVSPFVPIHVSPVQTHFSATPPFSVLHVAPAAHHPLPIQVPVISPTNAVPAQPNDVQVAAPNAGTLPTTVVSPPVQNVATPPTSIDQLPVSLPTPPQNHSSSHSVSSATFQNTNPSQACPVVRNNYVANGVFSADQYARYTPATCDDFFAGVRLRLAEALALPDDDAMIGRIMSHVTGQIPLLQGGIVGHLVIPLTVRTTDNQMFTANTTRISDATLGLSDGLYAELSSTDPIDPALRQKLLDVWTRQQPIINRGYAIACQQSATDPVPCSSGATPPSVPPIPPASSSSSSVPTQTSDFDFQIREVSTANTPYSDDFRYDITVRKRTPGTASYQLFLGGQTYLTSGYHIPGTSGYTNSTSFPLRFDNTNLGPNDPTWGYPHCQAVNSGAMCAGNNISPSLTETFSVIVIPQWRVDSAPTCEAFVLNMYVQQASIRTDLPSINKTARCFDAEAHVISSSSSASPIESPQTCTQISQSTWSCPPGVSPPATVPPTTQSSSSASAAPLTCNTGGLEQGKWYVTRVSPYQQFSIPKLLPDQFASNVGASSPVTRYFTAAGGQSVPVTGQQALMNIHKESTTSAWLGDSYLANIGNQIGNWLFVYKNADDTFFQNSFVSFWSPDWWYADRATNAAASDCRDFLQSMGYQPTIPGNYSANQGSVVNTTATPNTPLPTDPNERLFYTSPSIRWSAFTNFYKVDCTATVFTPTCQ